MDIMSQHSQKTPLSSAKQTATATKKKAETPRDLRKRNKRLEESRNFQREKNQQKSLKIKASGGKIDDLTESRNMWKSRSNESEYQITQLHEQIEIKESLLKEKDQLLETQTKLLKTERQLRLREIEERDKQINELKKKLMK